MSRVETPAPRWARYMVERGWAHLLMLFFAAVFLFPFLWMVLTSLKTDQELTEGGFWPALPSFRDASPYARPAIEVKRPEEATDANWDESRMRTRVYPLVDAALLRANLKPNDLADSSIRESAASAMVNDALSRIDKRVWSSDSKRVMDAFDRELTESAADAALSDRLARLELRELQIRMLDTRIFNISAGKSIAKDWSIESGDAKLVPVGDDALRVEYHFASSDAAPIVLRIEFDFAGDPSQLHKLMLAMRPDDSWHRLDATFDVAGRRWVSQRTTWLAQHRLMSAIFQPPTFDDSTYQPKTWIPLASAGSAGWASPTISKEVGSAHPTSKAVLRIIISPSSTLRAVYGKVLRNYSRAYYSMPFWRYVANSLTVVALTTIGALFSSAFVAYAFARLNWPGRSVALVILLATIMLPPQVTMIPSFMIWRQLHWYNTLNPMWVPAFFGGAFFIFLMIQHMKTLPRELEESARIDGLNIVQSWYYIILPQCKPVAAAIAIMAFMWSWNEFLTPLIYLRDQAKFPLSLGLYAMRLENAGDQTMIMAGNVLMTLPVIVIFFACQRYFIQGMTMSGIKG